MHKTRNSWQTSMYTSTLEKSLREILTIVTLGPKPSSFPAKTKKAARSAVHCASREGDLKRLSELDSPQKIDKEKQFWGRGWG